MANSRESERLWNALYDYKKMVGWGLFTSSSRHKLVEKLERKLKSQQGFTKEIHKFKPNTWTFGYSRLYALLAKEGFYSTCIGFEPKRKNYFEEKRLVDIMELQLLLDFAVKIRKSTGCWYGGWLSSLFRTQRKERYLDEIIYCLEKSIKAAQFFKKKIPANPANILRNIIHNAMVVRGFKGPTNSGREAVSLLNQSEYKPLRDLLPQWKDGQYDTLNAAVACSDKIYRGLSYS